jgi:TRAP-type C4-dicarboxylate transport system substrate-binding protein
MKVRRGTIMFTRREVMVGTGAVLTSAALVRSASAAVSLDLATVWPDGNFHTQNAKRFAEEVGKATGGEVKIIVHAGGSLGFKGPEQLRAVHDGLVPMADILNIQQIGDEPMLGTESIPFLVGSDKELKILHKYLRPEYEAIAAKNNQKVLYMVPWPTQYLHLKVKTDTLEGLKSVKIRVPDKNAQDMCAAVGMAPVLIPWGETIPALSSGAVAGVSTSAVSALTASSGNSSNISIRPITLGRARWSTSTTIPGRSSRERTRRRSRSLPRSSSRISGGPRSRRTRTV